MKNINILLASYERKWKNDLFRNFYYIIQILIYKYSYILIDISNIDINRKVVKFNDLVYKYNISINDINNIIYIENHNDFIITRIIPDLFELNIKKCILCDDIHKYYELKNNYYDLFDKIFVNYLKPFYKLYPRISKKKIYWIPHGYNPEFENLIYNINPKRKVLLAGCIGLMYPLRKKVFNYVKMNSEYTNIEIYKHPGYIGIDTKFPELINNYLCCITDCLTLNYVVSKYFEIPASGSLLLAKIPEGDNIESLGFKDMINFISVDENNFIEKIEFILDEKNKNIIDEIRYNGYVMIKENHSLIKRVDKMITLVNTF